LDDVGVLAGDHLEDLLGRIQVASAVFPRTGTACGLGLTDGRSGEQVCTGFAVEPDEERRVARGLDLVSDPRHDHSSGARLDPHVAWRRAVEIDETDTPALHTQLRPHGGQVGLLEEIRHGLEIEDWCVPALDQPAGKGRLIHKRLHLFLHWGRYAGACQRYRGGTDHQHGHPRRG
jgi:hypothetical protein